MEGVKSVATPMSTTTKLTKDEQENVSCALGPNNVVIYLINKMRCDFI